MTAVGKILDIESKYFIITDYNKFTSQTLDVKIKQVSFKNKGTDYVFGRKLKGVIIPNW